MAVRKRLGDLLIESGAIDELQLKAALAHQRQWGGRIGRILVEMRFVAEDEICDAVARQLGIPSVRLKGRTVDPSLLDLLPREYCERHWIFPLALVSGDRGGKLQVAMSDPTNLTIVDELAFRTGMRIEVAVAPDSHIDAAIRRHFYGEFIAEPEGEEPRPSPEDLPFGGEEFEPVPADALPGAGFDAAQEFEIVEAAPAASAFPAAAGGPPVLTYGSPPLPPSGSPLQGQDPRTAWTGATAPPPAPLRTPGPSATWSGASAGAAAPARAPGLGGRDPLADLFGAPGDASASDLLDSLLGPEDPAGPGSFPAAGGDDDMDAIRRELFAAPGDPVALGAEPAPEAAAPPPWIAAPADGAPDGTPGEWFPEESGEALGAGGPSDDPVLRRTRAAEPEGRSPTDRDPAHESGPAPGRADVSTGLEAPWGTAELLEEVESGEDGGPLVVGTLLAPPDGTDEGRAPAPVPADAAGLLSALEAMASGRGEGLPADKLLAALTLALVRRGLIAPADLLEGLR